MRHEDIDNLVGEAHSAVRRNMSDDPDRTPPGDSPSPGRRRPKGKARRVRDAVPPNPEPAPIEQHEHRVVREREHARTTALQV